MGDMDERFGIGVNVLLFRIGIGGAIFLIGEQVICLFGY